MPLYTQFIEKKLLLEKYESLMLRPNGFPVSLVMTVTQENLIHLP